MLVLSRQRDETIMIGDEIEITVVDIRGDKVRLGINAPARIAVHRKEVYEAIRRENEQAARIQNGDLAALRQSISPGPSRTRRADPAARLSQSPRAAGRHAGDDKRTA
ncbi:MAG: carbon storage regulator CsrA [Phycisphaeraceae bacterium]|nr:carbon storage regulator CsrA [Phycisphaeraceae bacterium]